MKGMDGTRAAANGFAFGDLPCDPNDRPFHPTAFPVPSQDTAQDESGDTDSHWRESEFLAPDTWVSRWHSRHFKQTAVIVLSFAQPFKGSLN
jgi:hypothetical protein